METPEVDSTPILLTIREFDEYDGLILVPIERMSRRLARAIGDAIPSIEDLVNNVVLRLP